MSVGPAAQDNSSFEITRLSINECRAQLLDSDSLEMLLETVKSPAAELSQPTIPCAWKCLADLREDGHKETSDMQLREAVQRLTAATLQCASELTLDEVELADEEGFVGSEIGVVAGSLAAVAVEASV